MKDYRVVDYKSYFTSTFLEYDIPYFLDIKRSIHTNPLVGLVLSLLDVLTSSWSYRAVMAFLKNGLICIDGVDYLENYVVAQGIRRRKQWLDEWHYGESGWDFARLNATRQEVVSIITDFERRLHEIRAVTKRRRFSAQIC